MCVHCESQLQAGWGQRLGMGHIIIRMYRRQSQKPTIVRNNGRARTQDWELRPTSHTRRPARDRCTSSTLIGWKRWSRPKFAASHYAWGTNGACQCTMDVMFTWIPTWHQMDHVSWSLGFHTLIGWKRWSWSKFAASHYAWGTDGVCECEMDVKSTWIPTWHRMDHVSWSLGPFSKTTSWR